MLKNYCHRARRQMLQVLVKSLALTHEYLTHDAANAVTVLSKHHVTFQVSGADQSPTPTCFRRRPTSLTSVTSLMEAAKSNAFCS